MHQLQGPSHDGLGPPQPLLPLTTLLLYHPKLLTGLIQTTLSKHAPSAPRRTRAA